MRKYADLSGKDIVDYLSIGLPTVPLPFGSVDLGGLFKRTIANIRNADGPVWFSSVLLRDPKTVKEGYVWDGSKTEAGMTGGAVYHVDWKIVRR